MQPLSVQISSVPQKTTLPVPHWNSIRFLYWFLAAAKNNWDNSTIFKQNLTCFKKFEKKYIFSNKIRIRILHFKKLHFFLSFLTTRYLTRYIDWGRSVNSRSLGTVQENDKFGRKMQGFFNSYLPDSLKGIFVCCVFAVSVLVSVMSLLFALPSNFHRSFSESENGQFSKTLSENLSNIIILFITFQ